MFIIIIIIIITTTIMCVSNFSTTSSEIFLIPRVIQRRMTINMHVSSCKVFVILAMFSSNNKFPDIFKKNTHIPYLMYIRPVGVQLFHVDGETAGRTDRRRVMTEVFATLPKPP